MTIGRKLLTGYVLVLTLLVVITIVSIYALGQMRASYDRLFDVNQQLAEAASDIGLRVRDQVVHFRGAVLYPQFRDEYVAKLETAREGAGEIAQSMRALIETEADRTALEALVSGQTALTRAQDRVLELLQTGERESALATGDFAAAQQSDALLALAEQFRDRQVDQVEQGRLGATANAAWLVRLMLILSLVAIVVGLSIATYLGRSITRQLQDSIMRLTSSAAQILATTAEVASGTAETATAVNETTATVEEVKQTTQMATQKARQVSDSAQRMTDVAQTGRSSIEETIEVMHNIQLQMESVGGSIVQLAEQSQAIGEIIATVNDLAEQSNLLAVNAAIEATRAGEHGRGFAVVAQEVRSLASQSKQATTQVRGILGEVQKATNAAVLATEQGNRAVEEGVRQTKATGQAINQLADSVFEASQAATQIAASNQQQLIGMDQVALAMDNIKQASSQNVAGTRQAETAAQDLQDLGRRLTSLISRSTA
jgi:methyl-accepting chemotaxis protein